MEEIQSTFSYGIFKPMPGNREISPLAVRRLVRSIKEIDLTPYKPIIVDAGFHIIDGQHRFQACKELGLPVYYVVMPENINSDKAMITFNQFQKNWRQEEFIGYHASKLGGCWKDLYEWDKKHGLGVSNSIVIYPDVGLGGTEIREGKPNRFAMNINADAIAEFLECPEIRQLRFSRTRPFVLAVRKAFERYTPKQINKLKKKMVFIQMSANYEQYLTAFENLLK